MNEGGYIVSKVVSEKINKLLFNMFKEIRKETEEFWEKEGPRLWKEFQELRKTGVSNEEAFYSVMATID